MVDATLIALRNLLRGKSLQWWEWAKLVFAATLPLAILGSRFPLLGGIFLHLFLDFTLQSSKIAEEKRSKGIFLWIHAIAVGGWSGGMTGFWLNGSLGFLYGILIGFVSHLLLDATDKFGIKDWRVAILVDQSLHFASLLAIVWLT